jgi:hypothetical protein
VSVASRTLVCGLLLAAGGIWSGSSALAQEPPRLSGLPDHPLPQFQPSTNQQIADAIADQLRQNDRLQHYTVQVVFSAGRAELTGTVADQAQREEVLRIAQGVPGVERVVDRMTLMKTGSITPVQAPPTFPVAPTPAGPASEPVPIFQAAPPAPYDVNTPKMPPYAWPTYAPYNNYSRVAYPEAYPYNAWPFIGPVYPFPKVPLGWRSVKLQWEDGHWWYSRVGHPYDWWHLRYW